MIKLLNILSEIRIISQTSFNKVLDLITSINNKVLNSKKFKKGTSKFQIIFNLSKGILYDKYHLSHAGSKNLKNELLLLSQPELHQLYIDLLKFKKDNNI